MQDDVLVKCDDAGYTFSLLSHFLTLSLTLSLSFSLSFSLSLSLFLTYTHTHTPIHISMYCPLTHCLLSHTDGVQYWHICRNANLGRVPQGFGRLPSLYICNVCEASDPDPHNSICMDCWRREHILLPCASCLRF